MRYDFSQKKPQKTTTATTTATKNNSNEKRCLIIFVKSKSLVTPKILLVLSISNINDAHIYYRFDSKINYLSQFLNCRVSSKVKF